MDPTFKTLENPSTNPDESPNPDAQSTITPTTTTTSPPMASISLSLSTILSTNLHLLHPPKPSSHLSSPPMKIKIPSQIQSLTHLSLSSTTPLHNSHKNSLKSTISACPIQSPLRGAPRRPSEPSNGAGIRRCAIVWFRNDLRVHDNECLNSANAESVSVMPVYCFDPRDFGKSSSGFDKTGPYRATFLVESVSDLRRSLRGRGSELVVRIGRPESVLVELAKAVGADAVYAHGEVSGDEVKAEEKIEKAMKDEGVELKYFWGSTLFHVDDLPFKLEDMPSNYGGFRDKVQRLEIRKTIDALDQLKGLPSRGDVEAGEIPTLLDLGLSPTATMTQDGKPAGHSSLVGGETEALQRLTKFAAECQAQPHNGGKDGSQSIYGANFSCKISPWLTMGCLSPRFMFDELKKSTARTISAVTSNKDGNNGSPGGGMNWLLFELLWRDFFRFITKKYSSAKKMLDNAPVTGCTGAAVA
ncbi:hypothetical protein Syun_028788 [Stephania yunnanensis]|uniref:Photolyase/cryptochrome alpha/beta domain-containing protein n=1 Tax=Stephania yunnanensis TaxID=152371 RepID=A0AAP0ECF9_9MAGN